MKRFDVVWRHRPGTRAGACRAQVSQGASTCVSGALFLQVFFDLLDLFFESLISNALAFSPRLALGFGLSGIGGDFATVNFLVTLFLAL